MSVFWQIVQVVQSLIIATAGCHCGLHLLFSWGQKPKIFKFARVISLCQSSFSFVVMSVWSCVISSLPSPTHWDIPLQILILLIFCLLIGASFTVMTLDPFSSEHRYASVATLVQRGITFKIPRSLTRLKKNMFDERYVILGGCLFGACIFGLILSILSTSSDYYLAFNAPLWALAWVFAITGSILLMHLVFRTHFEQPYNTTIRLQTASLASITVNVTVQLCLLCLVPVDGDVNDMLVANSPLLSQIAKEGCLLLCYCFMVEAGAMKKRERRRTSLGYPSVDVSARRKSLMAKRRKNSDTITAASISEQDQGVSDILEETTEEMSSSFEDESLEDESHILQPHELLEYTATKLARRRSSFQYPTGLDSLKQVVNFQKNFQDNVKAFRKSIGGEEETAPAVQEYIKGVQETTEGVKKAAEPFQETTEGVQETIDSVQKTADGVQETAEPLQEASEVVQETIKAAVEPLQETYAVQEAADAVQETTDMLNAQMV